MQADVPPAVLSFHDGRWFSTVPTNQGPLTLDVTDVLPTVYRSHGQQGITLAPCARAEVRRLIERLVAG